LNFCNNSSNGKNEFPNLKASGLILSVSLYCLGCQIQVLVLLILSIASVRSFSTYVSCGHLLGTCYSHTLFFLTSPYYSTVTPDLAAASKLLVIVIAVIFQHKSTVISCLLQPPVLAYAGTEGCFILHVFFISFFI